MFKKSDKIPLLASKKTPCHRGFDLKFKNGTGGTGTASTK
jgi:hypothetical protein